MKEKDLEKMLDSMIVDGLIKESEQDNADFKCAMSKISDEDFDDIVGVPEYADERTCDNMRTGTQEYATATASVNQQETSAVLQTKKRFSIKPWIWSLSAAAVILVCVLAPAYNIMNNKLCDSALIASNSYMTSTKGGFDVNTATKEQLKAELSTLERNYTKAADDEEKREAGWNLVQAYLKLHKKGDAVKVLKELNEKFSAGNDFGDPYQELLGILD